MKTIVKIHQEIMYTIYYGKEYCISYKDFKDAIKMVKETIKYNDNINEDFYIFFENENTKMLVATITTKN